MRAPMIPLMLAVVLVGCTTTEQEAQYMVNQVDYMVQVYGPACDKLGYQKNTDRWRDCIVSLSLKNEYSRYDGYYGYGYPPRYWVY